jgi:transaldolase
MREALKIMQGRPRAELLWASPREVLNVFQAAAVGCHIITATRDLLAKLPLVGKDHEQYSLETVEMFHRDAKTAGYAIPLRTA